MSEPGGFEPAVGELRAVRTFRVGPGGVLYPLFSKHPWLPGTNEAVCRLPGAAAHAPPDPDCTCGFYAYATRAAANEYPFARYVLGVVACWGRIITGTRGLRAQYCRIEALWLSPTVPADLADAVRGRYPDAPLYPSSEQMLAEHPLTELEDGEPIPTGWPKSWTRAAAGIALAAGSVPSSWIRTIPYGWWLWGALLAAFVLTAVGPTGRSVDPARRRRRVLATALALWMVAPFGGLSGLIFLRLPLLQIAGLTLAQRMAMNRLARTFPAPI